MSLHEWEHPLSNVFSTLKETRQNDDELTRSKYDTKAFNLMLSLSGMAREQNKSRLRKRSTTIYVSLNLSSSIPPSRIQIVSIPSGKSHILQIVNGPIFLPSKRHKGISSDIALNKSSIKKEWSESRGRRKGSGKRNRRITTRNH